MGVVDENELESGSGEVILIPVVFGDKGDAIIGAGIVYRFEMVALGEFELPTEVESPKERVGATTGSCAAGGGNGVVCLSILNVAFVGLTSWLLTALSERESSSHFPRTESMLLPTRCVAAHLRPPVADVGAPRTPVDFEIELERDKDDVRSIKRVWYAKGSAEELCFEDDDDVEDTEFERSMSCARPRGSRKVS